MVFIAAPLAGAVLLACAPFARAQENDAFWNALTQGKPDMYLRLRTEQVDDGTPSIRRATATSLRTALGYQTGLFHGIGLYGQFEDVHVIGNDRLYNDGGTNGIANRATIADPQGTEINQANIRFEGLPQTVLRYGRQEITHRDAPFHRYVGNILWRQNWQSFDGFRVTNQSVPKLLVDYSYVYNVNRIFGESNPVADRSDFHLKGHLVNVQYSGFSFGKFEPYAYVLDFEKPVSERFSTATYGLRFEGAAPLSDATKFLYTAEAAKQSDSGENPNDIGVNYYLGELGASHAYGGGNSVMLKLSYELLQGEGGVKSFQTPLGTNHAFQGWADRFLITPGDGIEDWFVTLRAGLFGVTFIAVYHQYSADNLGYDYGSEWNLQAEKTFAKRYTVGVKYANYEAGQNATNIARNTPGGQAFDLEKTWAYLQVKF